VEEIELKIITTAKIPNRFARESLQLFNKLSRESPRFQTDFDGSKRESPSLKRVDRKTVQSEDANI